MSRCARGSLFLWLLIMLLTGAPICLGTASSGGIDENYSHRIIKRNEGRRINGGLNNPSDTIWRDWLLIEDTQPSPSDTGNSGLLVRRITPKSVFVAPSFSGCSEGYRPDSMGRCVKVVKLNQAAQLGFLLQKLNSKFATPNTDNTNKDKDNNNSGPFHISLPLGSLENNNNAPNNKREDNLPTTTKETPKLITSTDVDSKTDTNTTNLPNTIMTTTTTRTPTIIDINTTTINIETSTFVDNLPITTTTIRNTKQPSVIKSNEDDYHLDITVKREPTSDDNHHNFNEDDTNKKPFVIVVATTNSSSTTHNKKQESNTELNPIIEYESSTTFPIFTTTDNTFIDDHNNNTTILSPNNRFNEEITTSETIRNEDSTTNTITTTNEQTTTIFPTTIDTTKNYESNYNVNLDSDFSLFNNNFHTQTTDYTTNTETNLPNNQETEVEEGSNNEDEFINPEDIIIQPEEEEEELENQEEEEIIKSVQQEDIKKDFNVKDSLLFSGSDTQTNKNMHGSVINQPDLNLQIEDNDNTKTNCDDLSIQISQSNYGKVINSNSKVNCRTSSPEVTTVKYPVRTTTSKPLSTYYSIRFPIESIGGLTTSNSKNNYRPIRFPEDSSSTYASSSGSYGTKIWNNDGISSPSSSSSMWFTPNSWFPSIFQPHRTWSNYQQNSNNDNNRNQQYQQSSLPNVYHKQYHSQPQVLPQSVPTWINRHSSWSQRDK